MKAMNCFAPAEVAGNACNVSSGKAKLSFGKLFILGILAGAYIGFGANLATVVGNDIPKFLGNGIGHFYWCRVQHGLMMWSWRSHCSLATTCS